MSEHAFSWEWFNVLLNVIIIVGGAIVSFFLRGMRDTITDLKTTDIGLQSKVSAIEVMIAGNYVTRSEFQRAFDQLSGALFSKLDRMEVKIDHKTDKP